jgi:hypothetical protein
MTTRVESDLVDPYRDHGWTAIATVEGLLFQQIASPGAVSEQVFGSVVIQWADDGFASRDDSGNWLIPWQSLYDILEDPGYFGVLAVAQLPVVADITPKLVSRGALSDHDFTIAIREWFGPKADLPSLSERLVGASFKTGDKLRVVPRASWNLLQAVTRFAQRSDTEKSERENRIAWGEIRRLALLANARMDEFLRQTVVLTPERLKIEFRKGSTTEVSLAEIVPGFDGCPEAWLTQFDRQTSVRDRYDIPTPHGVVQVVIRPDVKSVLEEIKKMPGRRVAGVRAQALLSNPFAALGESAHKVIDAEQFENSRSAAGLSFDRFSVALSEVHDLTVSIPISIVIESGDGIKSIQTKYTFDNFSALRRFVDIGRESISRGYQIFSWEGFEFEIRGETAYSLDVLEQALANSDGASSVQLRADDIYDLSRYSERIAGFGVEKAYASPYIARKDDAEGWFPGNIVRMIEIPGAQKDGKPIYVSLDDESLRQLQAEVEKAHHREEKDVVIPGTSYRIPLDEGRGIVSTFEIVDVDVQTGAFKTRSETTPRKPRKGLVLKPNIAAADYIERRKDVLDFKRTIIGLPSSLRVHVTLKPHQMEGVAWLQQLFIRSPRDCRGAVLADDMGLGKTLQLLTLIAWAHERDSKLAPALIVAPVALLENWRDEINKFFVRGALPLLELYGDSLHDMRVPHDQIDRQLKSDGLVRFLKPGWIGNAKVVLTTYETLRDLEFSFSSQVWSIFICDEAQKIKNPNALVTRAAKKQNAQFKVACTGTPVENTLADLWCLFDFVQPFLLGSLNEFGRQYRKPIEAETDEEAQRIKELRALIDPQILRRMKAEVATDLPKKIEDTQCKKLELSAIQRNLYAHAIDQFARRGESGQTTPFSNALGLLHYLRLICSDPQPFGMTGFSPEPLAVYCEKAPKLSWILSKLAEIQTRNEKALIFCEFKDIQRLLRHYIFESIGYSCDIINGDTTASSKSEFSRQKRIREFQERPGFGAIILSPLAVGFGVNIQAANHVIHYTRTWNPAKEDQATDRAYRIGQERDVFVYCPVIRASDFKTFEEKLDELLGHKRKLGEDMLNGAAEIKPGDFDISGVTPPGVRVASPKRLFFADVLKLTPRYFEAYVAALWLKKGYSRITITPQSGDGGIDVVAIRGNDGCLIQCKSSTSDRDLGWDAVKDVVTGEARYLAHYPGVKFQKVCVTNSRFNSGAHAQAEANDVELVESHSLEQLHAEHEIFVDDLERMLFPSWTT